MNAGTRKMFAHQTVHSSPSPTATSLAAAADTAKPQTSHLVNKTTDAVAVARNGVIIQPTLHNTPQPATRFAKWPVHSLSQFYFDRL